MDTTAIAARMKDARKLAGMSQEDAARALDVTVRTYARWERGETQGFLGELPRIAEVFDIQLVDLRGSDGPTTNGLAPSGVEEQLAALTAEVAALRQLMLNHYDDKG